MQKIKTVLNVFIEIVDESNSKSNKSWVDQGRAYYKKNYTRMVKQ